MNNKINLDNTQLRQYIQLLEGTHVSKEILEQFFKETYGIDVNDFNTQYDLCVNLEIDKMKNKLDTENDSTIDINELAKDEEKRENFILRDGDDDIWK